MFRSNDRSTAERLKLVVTGVALPTGVRDDAFFVGDHAPCANARGRRRGIVGTRKSSLAHVPRPFMNFAVLKFGRQRGWTILGYGCVERLAYKLLAQVRGVLVGGDASSEHFQDA